jgi:hypothetical protein
MGFISALGPKTAPKIFISYRRSGEGSGFGGRIADKLVKHFGRFQCFRDIENIEKGADFVESIKKATGHCQLLIVVIGPDWTTMKDEHGQIRLKNQTDFVRLEVATALERNIRVIPVLVGGAKMPTEKELPDDLKPLTRRQSHELSDQRWDYDSDELIRAIESIGIQGRSPEEQEARKRKVKIIMAASITALVVATSMATWFYTQKSDADDKFQDPAVTLIEGKDNDDYTPDDTKENNNLVPAGTLEKTTNVEKASLGGSITRQPAVNAEFEEQNIRNTIARAAQVEVQARQFGNADLLSTVYSGEALQLINGIIREELANGLNIQPRLQNQYFEGFELYTEGGRQYAEVNVVETWSGHIHRISDDLCVYHYDSHMSPQRHGLEKNGNSWFIRSISFLDATEPNLVICGGYD